MAAGTADAQPEEDLAGDVGDVVQDVGPLPAHVALVVFVGPQPEVAGRDPQLGIVGIELVAGKLLGQEAVVGFVGVERPDDVVAVTPGVGAKGILAIAVRLGIADQVEPVPRPALAVARRGQQAVDQALVGVGRVVGQECVDFLGGRRQPGQVEGRAADQGRLVGLRGGRQAVVEKRLENESVDRVSRPVGPVVGPRIDRLGNGRSANGLERPEGAVSGGELRSPVDWPRRLRGMGRAIAAGPGCTQGDPAGEDGDFLRAELAGGGHLEPLVVDRLDEQALVGLAGHDRRSRLAPLENRLQRVEPQAPFLLLVAVARVAVLGQERPDVLLEELLAGGLGRGVGLASGRMD